MLGPKIEPAGKVNSVSFELSENTPFVISVFSPKLIDSSLLEPANAPFEILLLPLKTSVLRAGVPEKIPPADKSTSPSKVAFSRAGQPEKEPTPKVEPAGKVSSVSFEQLPNILFAIFVFPPKVIVSILCALLKAPIERLLSPLKTIVLREVAPAKMPPAVKLISPSKVTLSRFVKS